MNKVKLPGWMQHLVATLGGVGLFAVAFLDSSVLSFPIVTDLLVIEESVQNHARMPYYAAMATVGSLAGCIWLYLIAKKSGEALYRRKSGAMAERIRGWVSQNAFLSAFIPALLPPPLPFKAFVLAEGVFQVPLRTFVVALLLGRGLRYFVEGILAVRYGEQATTFLLAHGKLTGFVTVGVVLILYVIARMLGKEKTDSTSAQQ
ncbi:MAG TPA: VTT domain-containing protein [Candidatus Acidoferrales bacterium]